MRVLALLCCLALPARAQPGAALPLCLTSPVNRDGRALLLPSRLGFAFRGAAPLDSYRSPGVTAIETGYVDDRTREGHAHTGQCKVRHFRRVVETAARHGITVNAHEPVMDTGERRTWPNMPSREGARGQEYNAGGGGNPPAHETILFCTRLPAGPLDYTPGIFLGAITDEEGRTLEVPLDFLPAGRRWVAEAYADAPDAHFLRNPRAIATTSRAVAPTDRLRLVLAPGGGQAIRFRPAD